MSTLGMTLDEFITQPRAALGKLSHLHRVLYLVGVLHFALLAAFVLGIFLDPRVVTGAPAWLKPAKFALSIGLYCFTFLWLLTYVQGRPKLVNTLASITALGFVFETLVIGIQAARGVQSHFNNITPFENVLYLSMGAVIAITVSMCLVLALLLAIQGAGNRAMTRSIQLGLVLVAFGSFLAFSMSAPKPDQLAQLQAGGSPSAVGGHAVDAPEDGPGLPVLGWSTLGGDIRAPHFVGIHAMQALPFIGWLLTRRKGSRLRPGQQEAIVWISGLGYGGLVALLLAQALRGQSVIAPDALTLGLLAAIILTVALAIALAVFWPARAPEESMQAS